MASLIRTFQADIVSAQKSATELLRTAKLISVKLGLSEIAEWIGHELTGYPSGDTVPPYRVVDGGHLEVFNPYRGWIPCGALNRDFKVIQPMPEIEELAQCESVVISLLRTNNYRVRGDTGVDMSDWQQQIQLPPIQLKSIINSVRDKLLDWALEMEKNGIIGEEMSFAPEEKQSAQSQTFHIQNATGVFGNVTNSQVTIYDYSSIHQAVKDAGVPREARNEIEDILDELKKAEPSKQTSLLERGKAWVTKNAELLGATASIVLKALGL